MRDMNRLYFLVWLLYLFRHCSSQTGSLFCMQPRYDGIKEPSNGFSNPQSTYFFRWPLGYVLQYYCDPGFRFTNGERRLRTTCTRSSNNITAQWTPRNLDDCIKYCDGCENNGKCSLFINKEERTKSYQCECPPGYVGNKCEKTVCDVAPYVGNSKSVNLIEGYRDNLTDKYAADSIISYTCMDGYHIEGNNELKCLVNGGVKKFVPAPPKCVANTMVVKKCPNVYEDANTYLGHLLRESKYRKHADYEEVKKTGYEWGDVVYFKCPPHSYIERIQGEYTTKFSVCDASGDWSRPWPICRQKTCSKPLIFSGDVSPPAYGNTLYPVGSKITFTCMRGHYLWLENSKETAICLSTELWDVKHPECITLNVFRNRCLLNRMKFEFKSNGYKNVPKCVAIPNANDENNDVNIITIVTASAAAVFGVLLLIVLIVAFHRRRLLHRIQRAEQERLDRCGSEQYGGGSPFEAVVQFILPSYDEAVRSKPTTDPPTFDEVMQEENERNQSSDVTDVPEEDIIADNVTVSTVDDNSAQTDFRNIIYIDNPLLEMRELSENNTDVPEDPDEQPPPYPGHFTVPENNRLDEIPSSDENIRSNETTRLNSFFHDNEML